MACRAPASNAICLPLNHRRVDHSEPHLIADMTPLAARLAVDESSLIRGAPSASFNTGSPASRRSASLRKGLIIAEGLLCSSVAMADDNVAVIVDGHAESR